MSIFEPKTTPRKKIILPTHDLLEEFFAALGGKVLTPYDVKEILAQIICVLLNNDEKTEEGLLKLPEVERLIYFNRIENARILHNGEQFASFQRAVHTLAYGVRQRLVEYGAYRGDEFPYFFDSLVGYDAVLSYLPH